MSDAYVDRYQLREKERLQDQAGTLVDLLHSDTSYPRGSVVLEGGVALEPRRLPWLNGARMPDLHRSMSPRTQSRKPRGARQQRPTTSSGSRRQVPTSCLCKN